MGWWRYIGLGFVGGTALSPVSMGWEFAAALACLAIVGSIRWPCSALAVVFGMAMGVAGVATTPRGPAIRGPVAVVACAIAARPGAEVLAWATWRRPGGVGSGVGRVLLRVPEGGLHSACVIGNGMAVSPRRPVLPGAPDIVRNRERSGVRTVIRMQRTRGLGVAASPGDKRELSPVIRALGTGDRSGISQASWDVLRRSGAAHLLAISGFHVGLVAWVVAALVGRCARLLALWRPEGCSGLWSSGAAVLAAMVWTAAVGAPVGAVRACGCVALWALARETGRALALEDALGLVSVVVLAWDPGMWGTPGFQLSFGAVWGISRWGPPTDRSWGWLSRSLATTIAATMGTLPAAAWWFQTLSPTGPVANLVAIPWVAGCLAPLSLVAAWGPEGIARYAAMGGSWAEQALLAVLTALAVPSFHPAVGPWGAVVLVVALSLRRRPWWLVVCTVTALGLRPRPVDHTIVTFLDVGHGDATVIEHPDGRVWLVDTGESGRDVASWLRRRGYRRLDALVLTHGDADHAGGTPALLDGFRVRRVWLGADRPDAAVSRALAAAGVPAGRAPARWWSPSCTTANDRSLVAQWPVGGGLTLAGDIQGCGERWSLSRLVPTSLVKVPHHGSISSSSWSWVQALRPSWAVVSSGSGPWRHPHPDVVARYASLGAKVLRTNLDGTIEARSIGERWVVRARAPGQPWVEIRAPVLEAATTPTPRTPE